MTAAEHTHSDGVLFNCVVDASVGIKLFLVEPLSDQAHRLFAHLTDDPPALFYVPDLFYIECANILWKYEQRFGYPAAQARQDIHDLVHLPLHSVPLTTLAEPALALAAETGCTAYDAAYVVLARELNLPLITADAALARRFADIEPDVCMLGEPAPAR